MSTLKPDPYAPRRGMASWTAVLGALAAAVFLLAGLPAQQAAFLPALAQAPADGTPEAGERRGILNLRLIDAPDPYLDLSDVRVVIRRIELRREALGDEGQVVVFDDPAEPRSFNLLNLTGGVSGRLVSAALPQGLYDQVRLFLDKEACYLVSDDGDEIRYFSSGSGALRFADEVDHGIVVDLEGHPIRIEEDMTTEFLVDWDVGRSLLAVPADAQSAAGVIYYELRPVLRGVALKGTGRIDGMAYQAGIKEVADGSGQVLSYPPLAGATVSAFRGDRLVAQTATNSSGMYALQGLEPGRYSLVFQRRGCREWREPGLEVREGRVVSLDVVLDPVSEPEVKDDAGDGVPMPLETR